MNAISRPRVFPGLVKLVISGYDGKPEYRDQIDVPGSANWFLDTHGMMPVEGWQDDETPFVGIIWSDCDATPENPWSFGVLIDEPEYPVIREHAAKNGYSVLMVSTVCEPEAYGDGHRGTVAICEHPEGWVVLPS